MHHLSAATALLLVGYAASAHTPRDDRASSPSPRQTVTAYTAWLQGCVKALRKDVPAMTRSAEAAARRFVNDGWTLAPWGEDWFVAEVSGRAGGIMPLGSVDATPGKTIVLLCPREARLREDLDQARQFAQRGDMVILLGRASVIAEARRAGVPFAAAFDTHAAPHGGLVERDGAWLVPTDPPAAIAAVWAWTAEFVGACTRLGKMPVMWQSIMVPGSAERNKTHAGKRFEDAPVAPVKPGALGREYLAKLEANVRAVFVGEQAAIDRAVKQAVDARAKGGRLYTYLFGHATMLQPGVPGDPGLFAKAYIEWNRPDDAIKLSPSDFVLCIGYDGVLRGETFGGFAEKARAAGAALAWSFTDYKPEEAKAVLAGETYIDQHWPLGDAVVTVPGYDVRILPTSGVISCGLYWAISAGVAAGQREAAERR